MAKGLTRLLFCPMAAARRRLYSAAAVLPAEAAAATADKKNTKPLYRRLSALGVAPPGSVTRTVNKWLREGRSVTVGQLMKYVKELRKYQRYGHALEVILIFFFLFPSFCLH